MIDPTAIDQVDTGSFFAIVIVAAVAAITVAIVPKRFAPPVVVLELMLGIVIGPQVLGLAHADDFIEFFSNLGLGMLFFFAGYEIDFERIKGRPMKLGASGWAALGRRSPTGSAASSPRPGSSSPSSTPARRWRRPRSAP